MYWDLGEVTKVSQEVTLRVKKVEIGKVIRQADHTQIGPGHVVIAVGIIEWEGGQHLNPDLKVHTLIEGIVAVLTQDMKTGINWDVIKIIGKDRKGFLLEVYQMVPTNIESKKSFKSLVI